MKDIYLQRRARLLDFLKTHNGVAIITANSISIRNDDVDFNFRQDSNFFYLTGFNEPECILVLHPGRTGEECTIFMRPLDKEMETWNGKRLGIERAPEELGVSKAYSISDFEKLAQEFLPKLQTLYVDFTRQTRLPSGIDLAEYLRQNFDSIRRKSSRAHGIRFTGMLDLQEALAPLRLVKSERELVFIKEAALINERAHRLAMAYARPGVFEYQIEALMTAIYRHQGANGVAYSPIVASGANALILHYVENNQQLKANDLLLIDAGPECSYYASDITRTFPINGTFSAAQKAVYEIVLAAQSAVEKNAAVGRTLKDLHQISVKTLVEGLRELKILTGTQDEEIDKKNYRRYFMHGNGHFLGLDVHDVDFGDLLLDGCLITNEPGLYIPENDPQCPEAFRGIGIRIEDNLFISSKGVLNLNTSIPKSVKAIEEACKMDWKSLWNTWVN